MVYSYTVYKSESRENVNLPKHAQAIVQIQEETSCQVDVQTTVRRKITCSADPSPTSSPILLLFISRAVVTLND
jgi:hypothetical protein